MKYSLDKNAKLEIELGYYDYPEHPFRKNPTDAGIDLHAFGNYIIESLSYKIIRTGINFELPKNTFGLVKPKSKNPFLIGGGVVDANYRGEILVKIFNPTKNELIIKHGDGIAQLIVIPIITPELEWVDEINENTDRGNSGGIVTELKGNK